MNQTEEKMILFRIVVNKENGGFSHASNFITKIVSKEELLPEDVTGISNRVFYKNPEETIMENKAWNLIRNEKFYQITRPQNILEVISGYHYEFGLLIDDEYLQDTVSIQPYILMKQFFKNIDIFAVIVGLEKHFFPMQFFLSDVLDNSIVGGSLLYYQRDKKLLQVMRRRRKGNLTAFYPLQIVDQDMLRFLSASLQEVWMENPQQNAEEILDCILQGNESIYKEVPVRLKNLCYALQMESALFKGINSKKAVELLLSGNVLTFILFVFTLRSRKKGDIAFSKESDVQNYYHKAEDYALGILQLIENIVFHASSHSGVFSMRVYNAKTEGYLNKKFPEAREASYLEVLIADYMGTNHGDNIADNFLNKLNTEERNIFNKLTPWDLIASGNDDEKVNPDVEAEFRKYYENLDNIGRHYGLKLFRNMVLKNHGAFHFYSCIGHTAHPGEIGGVEVGSAKEYFESFPGTGYYILLPMINYETEKNTLALDTQNGFKDFGTRLQNLDFKVNPYCFLDLKYNSQKEKDDLIETYVDFFQKIFDSHCGRPHVVQYIDVKNYNELQAELMYKALMKLALRRKMQDVVLHNCGEGFAKGFRKNAEIFFEKIGMEEIFVDRDFCIALYAANGEEEAVIYPGSMKNTFIANMTAESSHKREWIKQCAAYEKYSSSKADYVKIPYDILYDVYSEDGEKTIFGQYVKTVLDRDIQAEDYGCKLKNTHMRLGSTIHVSTFYEVEMLFHNNYFVVRFAMMIALWIYRNCRERLAAKMTICSYGMYSELLVNQLIGILADFNIGLERKNIDYVILEKETIEDKGIQVDRLRYSNAFQSEQERRDYFKDRQIISVVPINSTLKSHDKLLEIFKRENGIESGENFLSNFSLILVGEEQDNGYWKIDRLNRRCNPVANKTKVEPAPVFFVHLPIPYYEADACELCFPEDPLRETPLIEINVYSTVPKQSIGLVRKPSVKYSHKEYQNLFTDQDSILQKLYNSLIYTHIKRNGSHFLYYFSTEKLFLEQKDNICKWLKGISVPFSANSYHILFCPSHFSNAGFLEYVNRYVFHDATIVIRIDIDKEYRNNLFTKYEYLKMRIQELGSNSDTQYIIRAHYVDDCIITGKSYRRMLSLAQSMLYEYTREYQNITLLLFEYVFLLIDRNSEKTRQQYRMKSVAWGERKEEIEGKYLVYIDLNIPSMRSHGDSCTICQLERESLALSQTSSTHRMEIYWKNRKKNFRLKSVKEYEQECEKNHEKAPDKEKNYRRMYCYHMASILLGERIHGNQPEYALCAIVSLLIEDMEYHKSNQKQQFEYVLSYLKIISRPFLVYHKAIKEAIFRLLLMLSEWTIKGSQGRTLVSVAEEMAGDNEADADMLRLISALEGFLTPLLEKEENQKDFLLVCMKQLMELKSNYFIRKQNMMELKRYLQKWGKENRKFLYDRYLIYVKKLVGVSSDTSKSLWLNEEIEEILKNGQEEEYLPADILQQLILENVRVYYDGVERLSKDEQVQDAGDIEERIRNLRYRDFRKCIINKDESRIDYDTVWNGVRLFRFLRKEFLEDETRTWTSREKYYKIADIARNILKAENVYMLMATPLECEQWKREFEVKIEELLGESDGQKCVCEEKVKREYLIVSASDKDQTVLDVPISVIKVIENFERINRDEYVDENGECFVWKLGMESNHPIIVYAEFKETGKYKLLYQCRRLLMMSHLLNELAFSNNAVHYLYDIVKAENDAIRLSYYKSFSHTPEDIRKQQYNDIIVKKSEDYFKSHVVTLLSDLKISETYRQSLKSDYYSGKWKIKYGKLFGEQTLFGEISDFHVVDGMTQSHIQISIIKDRIFVVNGKQAIEGDSLIPGHQEIAFKNYANGSDELLLLMMALIENAASKGAVSYEGNGKKVEVYLSKTKEGRLRILNEVDTKEDIEKIRFFTTRPPRPKDGISIWSMSRYLLSLGCIVAQNLLVLCNNLPEGIGNDEAEKRILNCRRMIQSLLEGEFELKVNYLDILGHCYFSIELPVLAETYQRFLN